MKILYWIYDLHSSDCIWLSVMVKNNNVLWKVCEIDKLQVCITYDRQMSWTIAARGLFCTKIFWKLRNIMGHMNAQSLKWNIVY